MAAVVIHLGPKQWGAELLVKIAQGRRTGALRWQGQGGEDALLFRDGRPVALETTAGRSEERRDVVLAVRRFALRTAGSCSFVPDVDPGAAKPAVDTLGEVLLALVAEARPESVLLLIQ